MRACPILALMMLHCAAGGAAIPATSPLRCTITHAANRSTGEPTGMEGQSVLFSATDLKPQESIFTAHQIAHDRHGSETIDYHIQRAGLAFEATALRLRDDIGEEHIILLSGRCTPAVE
jgi:hypothetical protein